jgi:hypothetical protein
VFAVTNLCFDPIIWLFYPETRGLSLDEIDRVFTIKYGSECKMTYQEATLRAREELEAERLQIADVTPPNEEKPAICHVEVRV